jgi:arginase family enzyme
MRAAPILGEAIARRISGSVEMIGREEPLVDGDWRSQLREALPGLRILAGLLARQLETAEPAFSVLGRCAAGLATLPAVARRHPEAAIVYFDAHGDCNTPFEHPSPETAYLGGMVLTGASGEWSTGLGGELDLSQVALVGSRDLDPAERKRVAAGELRLVEPGPRLAARMLAAVGNRPVYVHLDCDVLNAGLLPTEYQVPGGLCWDELHDACAALRNRRLIGLEICEYEGIWPDGKAGELDRLIDAIAPLLGV